MASNEDWPIDGGGDRGGDGGGDGRWPCAVACYLGEACVRAQREEKQAARGSEGKRQAIRASRNHLQSRLPKVHLRMWTGMRRSVRKSGRAIKKSRNCLPERAKDASHARERRAEHPRGISERPRRSTGGSDRQQRHAAHAGKAVDVSKAGLRFSGHLVAAGPPA